MVVVVAVVVVVVVVLVLVMVGYLTSQQQAGVSRGRICSNNCTCRHTEIEVADRTSDLTYSRYTDIGPTSPTTDLYNARRLAR